MLTRRAVRFARLDARERRAALEAAAVLALVRLLVAVLPFARVMRLLGLRLADGGAAGTAAGAADGAAARAVSDAVARASRNLPLRAVCLHQAAAAAVMLRRRGLPAEVRFGVARRAGTVEAHAWSLSGGVPVTGAAESRDFAPIAVFRA
ncbi:MAG TPA: lasso peptide biosynthesis B2 protein [Azospirillaceae bacterium]|nr:lasso peptide biosynthesis B2 protein [Azospirillaceae bacterium]